MFINLMEIIVVVVGISSFLEIHVLYIRIYFDHVMFIIYFICGLWFQSQNKQKYIILEVIVDILIVL